MLSLDQLDLLTLRCFQVAAERLNFRAAADALHMSPAALGKRIAALERQLGAQLFERTTRRVSLTDRGAQVVPVVHRLLDQCTRFAQELAAPSPVAYALTVGTRFELGLSWLTPALDVLASKRPQRMIHLSFGDSADMIERVQNGQVDAAVTSSRQRPKGAQHVTLHQEDYVFVGSAALLRRLPLRGARDAARHTLLDIGPRRPLFRYFSGAKRKGAPWSFKKLQCLGTIAAIRQRALGGHGVAVLPLYFVAPDLEQRELVRIAPSVKPQSDAFRLVWLADHPKAVQLQELGEDLQAIPLA
ncbi:MAG: LysR family transcriptional regulator [Planctomycetota bacterium]